MSRRLDGIMALHGKAMSGDAGARDELLALVPKMVQVQRALGERIRELERREDDPLSVFDTIFGKK